MSADVSINRAPCVTCGHAPDSYDDSLNITYNLTKMLREAGFIGWRHIVGLPAPVVGAHIVGVLDGMAANPERWRAMNPKNGWGKYDECIQKRMRAWAERCVGASDRDTIGGSL